MLNKTVNSINLKVIINKTVYLINLMHIFENLGCSVVKILTYFL
jgi:hypothetical protein